MNVSRIISVARPNLSKIEVIIVIVAIAGASVTLALGGLVRSDTIRMADVSSSLVAPYGEPDSSSTVGYADNFTGWVVSPQNTQVASTQTSIAMQGVFPNVPTWNSVVLSKSVNINITSYSILNAEINVTTGVQYGIRFFAQFPNATEYNVWWEGSPLDHRQGKGFESLRVNMQRQALLATGQNVQVINRIELYVGDPPNSPQSFKLALTRLYFEGYSLESLSGNQYRAIYFDLGNFPRSNSSWNLDHLSIDVTVQASPSSTFTIYVFNGLTILGSSTTTELAFNSLTASSEYSFYPNSELQIFPERLPASNESIVFVASAGILQDIHITDANFIFLPATTAPAVSQQSLGLYYVYFVFFLFLLPLGVAILVFHEFFARKLVPNASVVWVLVVGIISRIALAPTTAHVFDMNVYLSSSRAWFQFKSPRGSPGPTLPLAYFLYWMSYSPYAVLQLAGFQDAQFIGHAAGVVESVFVKAFPITVDILTYFLMLRFRKDGIGFVWAAFYYLNPLTIFTSSVWGQYDAVTMAFVLGGVYLMSSQKYARAALAFVISGMIGMVGFFPYTLLLLWNARSKLYKPIAMGFVATAPLFLYRPEIDLVFRIFLNSVGFVHGQFSQAGPYTVLGEFPQLSIISVFKPLLLSQLGVLFMAGLDIYRKRMNPERLVFFLCLSSIFLLLFSNLLASWVWLVAICSLYASIRGKNDLGAFMLVFGASITFVEVSDTTGSAYLLLGIVGYPILPFIEGVANRVRIFTVMVTALTLLVLFYLKFGNRDPRQTLLRTSGITFALYLLLYFWFVVFPV